MAGVAGTFVLQNACREDIAGLFEQVMRGRWEASALTLQEFGVGACAVLKLDASR